MESGPWKGRAVNPDFPRRGGAFGLASGRGISYHLPLLSMTTPRDHGWLRELLPCFANKRILVVGDLMLDEFIWGRVSRISPEAPVPIVEVHKQEYFPGGAANVARNLREFTDSVAVMGIVGADPHADVLGSLLTAQHISLEGVLRLPGYQTTVKTRIIARQQHVVRVDREGPPPAEQDFHAQTMEKFARMLPDYDAVIVEDYAKGFLTQAFVEGIGALARAAGKIVTVDPNPRNDLRWTGVTAIKPNRAEAFHAAGYTVSEAAAPGAQTPVLAEVAAKLLEKWDTEMLLITLSENGMALFRRGQPPEAIQPCQPREVFDVSGAGDTSIALFTLALAAGATPRQAAEIANHAGSVVVGKLGTATLTAAELIASFEQHL